MGAIYDRRKFLWSLMSLPALTACARAPVATEDSYLALRLDGRSDQEVFMSFNDQLEASPAENKSPRYIAVDARFSPNQILVMQEKLVIQHIYAQGLAREYPVGLGRAGLEFSGEAVIQRKAEWPSWRPTDEMIARNPGHYGKFADGVPGGPKNPLGARALYLYKNGVDTYYRIHGTDAPDTIGQYVSNGCIRMLNEHVIELYDRVMIGTKVRVV